MAEAQISTEERQDFYVRLHRLRAEAAAGFANRYYGQKYPDGSHRPNGLPSEDIEAIRILYFASAGERPPLTPSCHHVLVQFSALCSQLVGRIQQSRPRTDLKQYTDWHVLIGSTIPPESFDNNRVSRQYLSGNPVVRFFRQCANGQLPESYEPEPIPNGLIGEPAARRYVRAADLAGRRPQRRPDNC